jgi:two-component system chemotaxis response regulator CheB
VFISPQQLLVESSGVAEVGPGFVAIGTSAGGLRALQTVLCDLPGDFPAPIAVVQHLDPRAPSLMASILARRTALTVREARPGLLARPGHVYIARPDYHLLIKADGYLALSHTKCVKFVRPSVDLLFDSLACAYRERAVAVILTGSGTDGASGVAAIKRMGGIVIVQSEETAEFTGMPAAALRAASVDMVLPLNDVASALQRILGSRATR